MIYPILQLPNPILRKKLSPLTRVDKKLYEFLVNFQETLQKQVDPEGLGLSANQVGFEYRMFLGRIAKREIRLFINPEILEFSQEKVVMTEGCLSIKSLYSKIERPAKVKLKYSVLPSNPSISSIPSPIIEEFDNLNARVIQHEVDHLNGVVFIDHALRQKSPIFRLIKHKNGEDEFVEMKI